MFSYLTGAAKKAVSRRGKEPHKFRSASRPPPVDPRPVLRREKSKQRRPDLAHAPHPPTLLRRLTLTAPSYRRLPQDRRDCRVRLGAPGEGQGRMRDPGACATPLAARRHILE